MESYVSQKVNSFEVFPKSCFLISWEEISTKFGQNKFLQVRKMICLGDSKNETLVKLGL